MNIMDRKLGHIIQLDANVMLGGGGGGGGEVSIVQCNDAELWPSLSLTIR